MHPNSVNSVNPLALIAFFISATFCNSISTYDKDVTLTLKEKALLDEV